MKKARIIIPALAALAFSTVASVTGTVAWFTSQSAVTVETSNFQVKGLDGALDVTMAPGIGTAEGKVVGTGETRRVTSIAPKKYNGDTEPALLTHGSFNAETKEVYTKNQYAENELIDLGTLGGQNKADTPVAFSEADVTEDPVGHKLNIFTWTITFTLKVTDGKSRNLYFDATPTVSGAVASNTAGLSGELADNAARGLRIAFITDSAKTVWSPLQGYKMAPKEEVNSCYAIAEKGTISADYNETYKTTGVNLIYQNDTSVAKITTQNGGTDRKDYLGSFSSVSSTVTVTCVAWFEGFDDQNIRSEVPVMPSVDTTMGFYVRNAA